MGSIMVNSNPETLSTDFDTSDRLYFEPLTAEDVWHIYQKEKPKGIQGDFIMSSYLTSTMGVSYKIKTKAQ